MGRTLRNKIKKDLAHPFLVYMLRKWNSKVVSPELKKEEVKYNPNISWADWDDDDQELPPLPETFVKQPKKIIKFTPEYNYKNTCFKLI
jgi:hypothetical protein